MEGRYVYRRNPDECRECGFCEEHILCPGVGGSTIHRPERLCVGCGVCYVACPYEAVEAVTDETPRSTVRIVVDGEVYEVPERTTVRHALQTLGWEFTKIPVEGRLYAPCETSGCYACALLVDGELRPSCTTPVKDGMEISTNLEGYTPLRRVSGYQPHPVGGVGTPWWIKGESRYIEVACFAHGCNLRCPQCQNYSVTYDNVTPPSTPVEAARRLTWLRWWYNVDRMAISGGEPTLNRPWLIKFFTELRRLNKDPKARLHLDTNATLLTPDYIDELVEAGVTDIGPDLKGLRVETFMEITGIRDKDLASKYLKNSWSAVKYILDEYYPDRVFLGIGIPYNRCFMSLEELREIGDRIASMNPQVQVCILDYFPTFRRRNMRKPTVEEMRKARETLLEAGLKTVIAQTAIGYLGP